MDAAIQSFTYSIDFIREQVADLDADQMVLQPDDILNHPAWVLGHLSASCQALGREIGLEPWLPENWGVRFGMGSIPSSSASDYESKGELLEVLRRARLRITRAVQGLSSEQLDQALPIEKYGPTLPTVRHAIVQMLVAHSAYHVGQLQQWRREAGLPRLGRAYL